MSPEMTSEMDIAAPGTIIIIAAGGEKDEFHTKVGRPSGQSKFDGNTRSCFACIPRLRELNRSL